MPLVDHFHPPISIRRQWQSFLSSWGIQIADHLNRTLPADSFAELHVKTAARHESEIALCEIDCSLRDSAQSGAQAVSEPDGLPFFPPATVAAVFPDEFEVQIIDASNGPRLSAVIQFVSPGNKDVPDTRKAFIAKCASYLQHGIGLMVIDIVTSRKANLHDQLIEFLGRDGPFAFDQPVSLYTTAYRPAHRDRRNEIDLWREELKIGGLLPTMPLAIRGYRTLPIDLEATYMEARQRGRVG